jgi:hypothetical protein
VFTAQPSNATAGTAMPAIQVTAQDASGNAVTSFTGAVMVAITAGSGTSGAILSGTTTLAAVAGSATFGNLSIDKSGTGYTLTATATALTNATSGALAVNAGPATQLFFTVPPSTVTAGAAITPQIEVTARDAQGNTAVGFTGNVTVAIGANPGGGVLSGTATVAVVAGVAAFNSLSINAAGSGYTLTAAATGPAGAVSAAFDVTAAQADRLVFTLQPSSAIAGATISPAIEVTARDGLGNTGDDLHGECDADDYLGDRHRWSHTVGTKPSPPSSGGHLLHAQHRQVRHRVSVVGHGHRCGWGHERELHHHPRNGDQARVHHPAHHHAAATAIAPAVQVSAQDAQGNTVTSFTGTVGVTIGTNPGAGTLSGTASLAAVGGVATFANLAIDKSGVGYWLTAASGTLTGATSTSFNINAGPATQLVYTVQPSSAAAGATIAPAVQLTARDAQGNLATGFTGGAANVTVAIATSPAGGTLAGTKTVAAVLGVATFSTLASTRRGSVTPSPPRPPA